MQPPLPPPRPWISTSLDKISVPLLGGFVWQCVTVYSCVKLFVSVCGSVWLCAPLANDD